MGIHIHKGLRYLRGFLILVSLTAIVLGGYPLAYSRADTALSPDEAAKAHSIFKTGLRLYRQGKLEEALSAFQLAYNLNPTPPKYKEYIALAVKRIKEKRAAEKAAPLQVEEEVKAQEAGEFYAQGLYALEYARYEEAIQLFRHVLSLKPQHQGALSGLAQAWMEIEQRQRNAEKKQEVAREEKPALPPKPAVSEGAPPLLAQKPAPQEKAKEVPAKPREKKVLPGAELKKEELLKKAREVQIEGLYRQAQLLFKRGLNQEAYDKFREIEKSMPDYRHTRDFLLALRMAEEAERQEREPPRYTLGPEDIIEINVQDHPELSGRVSVESGGEIIIPLVKEVILANSLTTEELAAKIQERLAKYVREPQVQIVIVGYNSKKWYILGEVQRQGEYPMGKVNLTLMEALYWAGLPVEGKAAVRRVLLIKPHKTNPHTQVIDVYSILYEGKLQNNVRLDPGDIIYVPKTVLAKISSVITQTTSPITSSRTMLEDLDSTAAAARAITPIHPALFGRTPDDKKTIQH